MARRIGEADEVEGLDEEFLFHLNRGSDLITRSDPAGARAALERALELRPRDPKVLGLLGQAHYRLGKYDDAIVAWQRLVDENPADEETTYNATDAVNNVEVTPSSYTWTIDTTGEFWSIHRLFSRDEIYVRSLRNR